MGSFQQLLVIIACLLHATMCTRELSKKLDGFNVYPEQLNQLKLACIQQMRVGLRGDGKGLPMFQSFITHFPTKNESGTFLSADLGGTYFRIAFTNIELGNCRFIDRLSIAIPDLVKAGSSHKPLFDFMAKNLLEFVVKNSESPKRIKLALTFSYPFLQTKLNEGILTSWSKGINLPSAVDKNVVELLQHSLDELSATYGAKIHVSAILNDTVAQVLAYKWVCKDVLLSSIFGTGTNGGLIVPVTGAFFGKDKLKNYQLISDEQTIINTEWGSFYEPELFPLTEYDAQVDAKSNNPGKQRLEKLISGFYILEIIKEFLSTEYPKIYLKYKTKLTNEFVGVLADGKDVRSSEMQRLVSLSTECFRTSSETESNSNAVREIDAMKFLPDELVIIQQVAQSVYKRCAQLSAVLIVSGLEFTGKKKEEYAVSFDGALYENSAIFRKFLHQTIKDMLDGFMPTIVYQSNLSCTLLGGAVLLASQQEAENRSVQ